MDDKTSVFMWQENVMGKEGRKKRDETALWSKYFSTTQKHVQDTQRQGLD